MQPGDVRDDQPDEHDRAAGGRRRTTQQRDRREQHEPGPADALAEGDGNVLTEREPIERPTARERDDEPHDDERPGLPDHVHVATGKRAHLPEAQLVEGVDVGHDDGCREGGQPDRHGDAG